MRYDIRIPGYGGAAVLLRKTVGGNPPTQTAIDISLVAPHLVNTVRGREIGGDFLPDWACWLFAAASDSAPEQTLDPFEGASSGVAIKVVSSNDERIELLTSVTDEVGGNDDDAQKMNFESSRAALVHSAQCLSDLCSGIDLAIFEEMGE